MKWNDFRHQAYRCASSAGFTKQPALEHHPSQQVESNLAIFSESHTRAFRGAHTTRRTLYVQPLDQTCQ